MWTIDEKAAVEMELERLFDLAKWLDDCGGAVQIPSNQREVLAGGCLDQTLEHQRAILLLTLSGLHGSAHALGRSVFESFTRGMWLYRCASDDQVMAFANEDHKSLPHLRDASLFVRDIERALDHTSDVLGNFRDRYWKILCAFAHTGAMQAGRRFGEDESRGYLVDEVIFLLREAAFLGLFAMLEIAWIGGQRDVAQAVADRTSEYLASFAHAEVRGTGESHAE
ncbi:hypothetical protein AB4Z27_05815 [Cupriavidus sp. KB_39]|uniref:DUF6988 family protein n=1 Tax=Cupriavidus sp. KB_39 TaxID=3233036 RepID=UPI003F8E05CF